VQQADDPEKEGFVAVHDFGWQAARGGRLFKGLPGQQASLDQAAFELVAAGVKQVGRVQVRHLASQAIGLLGGNARLASLQVDHSS